MDKISEHTIKTIAKLAELPSSTLKVPEGKYVIKSTAPDEFESPDNQFNGKTWFYSPPLKSETINRLESLQLLAETHDQGYADDKDAGNWTWLDIAILENENDNNPKEVDGVKLVWRSHRNRFLTFEFGWAAGKVFGSDHDIFRLLEDGNVIAVRLGARFTNWAIYANKGYLVVHVGANEVDREAPAYGVITSQLKGIQQTIKIVNQQTKNGFAEFALSLPEKFRADAFGKADKPPLRVLALDGGGVRGLSTLLILDKVMGQIAPNKKPCDVFDIIGGTSTGGLIAIMLGRLKMDIKDCIKTYKEFMTKIFGTKTWAETMKQKAQQTLSRPKFSHEPLEEVLRQVIKQHSGREDTELMNPDENECKVFVVAARKDASNNHEPVILRSYRNSNKLLELADIQLWQAARATSAAPGYFKEIKVGPYELIDGGVLANNPLGWLWSEVLSVFGADRSTDCFLSIGTGIPPNSRLGNLGPDPLGTAQTQLASIMTNTEIVHILFKGLINSFAPKASQNKYWRLNVGKPIAAYEDPKTHEKHLDDYHPVGGEMDDTTKLGDMEKDTKEYIEAQKADISTIASVLANSLKSKA